MDVFFLGSWGNESERGTNCPKISCKFMHYLQVKECPTLEPQWPCLFARTSHGVYENDFFIHSFMYKFEFLDYFFLQTKFHLQTISLSICFIYSNGRFEESSFHSFTMNSKTATLVFAKITASRLHKIPTFPN